MSAVCTLYMNSTSLENVLVEITFCDRSGCFPLSFESKEAYSVRGQAFWINTQLHKPTHHPAAGPAMPHRTARGAGGVAWAFGRALTQMGEWEFHFSSPFLRETECMTCAVQGSTDGGGPHHQCQLSPYLEKGQVTCVGVAIHILKIRKEAIHLQMNLPALEIYKSQTP